MAGKVIICDLDGTIWDSYPCYAAALDTLGVCSATEGLKRLRAGENLIRLTRNAGITNARLTGHCLDSIGKLALYQKVHHTLEVCREKGVPLGIVTNLPAWLVTPLLDCIGIAKFFGIAVAAAKKPSPHGLVSAVSALNGKARTQVFYVGDTEGDSQAAAAAGVPFIWAAYGYGTEPDSLHAKIQRFDQILEL